MLLNVKVVYKSLFIYYYPKPWTLIFSKGDFFLQDCAVIGFESLSFVTKL